MCLFASSASCNRLLLRIGNAIREADVSAYFETALLTSIPDFCGEELKPVTPPTKSPPPASYTCSRRNTNVGGMDYFARDWRRVEYRGG